MSSLNDHLLRILVVSDSHGDFSALKKALKKEEKNKDNKEINPIDLLIHLGDGVLDALRLQRITNIPVEAVNGNNDPTGAFPDELCVTLGKIKLFLTHGDKFNSPLNLRAISKLTRHKKADIVFFGHTHQYLYQKKKGVTIVNPGAICRWEKNPGYVLIEIYGKDFRIERKCLK